MDHTDATATQATERYLLGELNAEETNAFEEHYFDCHLCAEDVRTGTAFFEGGRRLVREEREQERPVAPVAQIDEHPRWRRWIPAAAAAMFAYLTMVPLLMRTAAPVAKPMFALSGAAGIPIDSQNRGEVGDGEPIVPPLITLKGDEPGVLFYDLPGDEEHTRFQVRVLGPDGKVFETRLFTKEEVADGAPRHLVLQGAEAGTYFLEISAAGPAGQFKEISRRPFVVKHAVQSGGQRF
ncbi:MAG TPA: hypothetical protein VF883_12800 [Thermoanaerobaculia bacterium]|jgi:hypothetical protein